MQTTGLHGFLRRLYRVARPEASDRELVAALAARRDDAAFEALVQRHGPMVLAVCQRVLRHMHDAEDAFQATFLVLVRKAAAIRHPDALAGWLYGVAHLTAQKARLANAKRRAAEARAAPGPTLKGTDPDGLDEELCGLPEKYRVPLVLCELEGRSRTEVAGQLGIPEGTLSSRLAKGRKMLAQRLRRHGWDVTGLLPAAPLLPVTLATTTIEAGRSVLAGRETSRLISARVITLSSGVMRTMFFRQIKTLTVILMVAGAIGLGGGRYAQGVFGGGSAVAADDKPETPAEAVKRAEAEVQRAEAALAAARIQFIRASQLDAQRVVAEQQSRLAQQLASTTRGVLPAARAERDALLQKIGGLFQYRIPVEIGRTESKDGGRIQIVDIWGTKPEIAVGGSYLVRG
jgi:RNA polymerase sigma factor (sigma-70 family)